MKPVYLLLFLLPLFFQCNRTAYTSSDFPDDYLEFGRGGGYSGEVSAYYILPNGQVFNTNSLNADTIAAAPLSRGVAKDLMERFETLGLDTLQFNEPGNIYSFLRRHSQDTVLELSWGNHLPPPTVLKNYYQELMDAVKPAVEQQELE